MNTSENENKYLRAKEKVQKIKKFYMKLLSNLFVILLTGAINYYLNEWSYPWFLWVVFGVSISTIINAVKIFGYDAFLGSNWEERKINEIMSEEETKKRWK